MLTKLPTDLLLNFLISWFELIDIGKFDLSCVNIDSRRFLLLGFQMPGYVCSYDTFKFSLSSAFFSWVSWRNIKLLLFNFTNVCFTNQHRIIPRFNLINTTKITFAAVNSVVDLVNVLNQTKVLTSLNVSFRNCNLVETCILIDTFVLLKLKSIVVKMNESKDQKWSTIFDAILFYCSNVLHLELSGRGLKQIQNQEVVKLLKQTSKLQFLLLSCPISAEVLYNIAHRTPPLNTLLSFLSTKCSSDLWFIVAQLLQYPIVSGTMVLSSLQYVTKDKALFVNSCTHSLSKIAQVPDSFFNISMNLLSVTLGEQYLITTAILTKISVSNPLLISMTINCKCFVLSLNVMQMFLFNMECLETLVVKSLSHMTADDVASLFCDSYRKTLKKIQIRFCVPMSTSHIRKIINNNPQLKILNISTHDKFIVPRDNQQVIVNSVDKGLNFLCQQCN